MSSWAGDLVAQKKDIIVKIYLVGGAIRDEIMGRTVQDRDYVVFGATEDDFIRRFPTARKIGSRKPIYLHNGDEYTLSTEVDIHSDLNKRDLTINAFARDESGQIFSHPFAYKDLEGKLLRPIAHENFLNDPLRVYRGARFSSFFPDFTVHPSLTNLMRRIGEKGLLKNIAAERVGNELLKAYGGRKPSAFLRLLLKTGTLNPWFNELAGFHEIPAGPEPFHSESLFDHVSELMDKLAGTPLIVWMALCHDLGKSKTDPAHWPKHHGHDIVGEELAVSLGRRLKLPGRYIQAGAAAARWHMVAGNYSSLRPGTRIELLVNLANLGIIDEFFQMVTIDKGQDFYSQAKSDLDVVLSVKLPPAYHNLGPKSGEILHQLRCDVLRQMKAKSR